MKQIFIEKLECCYKVTYKGFSVIYSDLDEAYNWLKKCVNDDIKEVVCELEDTFFYRQTDSRYFNFKLLEILIKRRAAIRRQFEEIKERVI